MLDVRDTPEGAVLRVRVVPRAGRTTIDGIVDGAIRVRLAAPPVEGAANRSLIGLLAETLAVSKRDVEIVSGTRGRLKTVRIRNRAASEVRARIPA